MFKSVIIDCVDCEYKELPSWKEPCLTCLIKSYEEGDTDVFEEEVDDGEET